MPLPQSPSGCVRWRVLGSSEGSPDRPCVGSAACDYYPRLCPGVQLGFSLVSGLWSSQAAGSAPCVPAFSAELCLSLLISTAGSQGFRPPAVLVGVNTGIKAELSHWYQVSLPGRLPLPGHPQPDSGLQPLSQASLVSALFKVPCTAAAPAPPAPALGSREGDAGCASCSWLPAKPHRGRAGSARLPVCWSGPGAGKEGRRLPRG